MRDVFSNLLVSCPNNGGLFLLYRGATYKLDNLDTTGLVIHEAAMLRALQPARLVRFEGANQDGITSEADFDDIHDVLMDGDFRYVVKTDTNEIIKLDQYGQEQQRWTLPGERDSWHVNCLARWNDRLVFSAFGDLRSHKEYKVTSRGLGFVQDLATGVRLITDLSQPHSLLAVGDKLLLANSESFEIREYGASGRLLRTKALDGYTRGLLWHEGVLFVGLSKSRNVHSSRLTHALVIALDAESWEEIDRRPLSVEEVFSIQHVSDAAIVGALSKLASHATGLLSDRIGKYERDIVDLGVHAEAAEEEAKQARLEMAAKEGFLHDKDVRVHEQDEVIRENERKIFGLLETVHGKDLHIQSREEVIRAKDLEIQRRDEMLHAKDRELATRDDAIHGRDTHILVRDEMIQRLEARVVEMRLDLLARDSDLDRLNKDLERMDGEIARLQRLTEVKDEELKRAVEASKSMAGKVSAADTLIRDKERERADLQQLAATNVEKLLALTRESSTLVESVEHLQHKLAMLESSLSWRLTGPLRVTKRMGKGILGGILRPIRGLGHVLKTGEARAKYVSLAKSLGPAGALKHAYGFLRRGGPKPAPQIDGGVLFDLRQSAALPVVVLCTKHCRYVGEAIVRALGRVGIASRIIFEQPEHGYDDVPHFVICPQMFPTLPGLYVSFQMEQSVSSRWFTADYLRRLENSFAIFDYSLDNIEKLVSLGLHAKQLYYLPIAFLPEYVAPQVDTEYEYDVLFYGDINNDRRRSCLAALQKVCKVKVVNDTFGPALFSEIAKAKVVVNIHYYPGALLETTRIWECLSLGKLVVSERSSDMQHHDELLPLVDFVNVDDFGGMVSRVRYWLVDDDRRQERVQANNQSLHLMFNRFDYFFYRFLLATDNISFEDFWALVGSRYPLSSDKLSLNLPEYVARAASFDKDNVYGFQRFPGLRHSKGWVGCALSYKYMVRLAREHDMPAVTICEDDVDFPSGFAATWPGLYDYLLENAADWDIFSGLMADLHPEAKVLDVRNHGKYQLATTDKLISTVFNVYNRSCYDIIASWDETNRDVKTNTIDRYLEKSRAIKVMIASPFLVGHKEELYSTLWGGQNTIYTELIAKSQALLLQKIDAYKRSSRW